MCFLHCKRKSSSVKPNNQEEKESDVYISFEFLVEHYIKLSQNINKDNIFTAYMSQTFYSLMNMTEKIEREHLITKRDKLLYEKYKVHRDRIDKLLNYPGNSKIKKELIVPEPMLEPTVESPKWFTRVQRIDENGRIISTQYLS